MVLRVLEMIYDVFVTLKVGAKSIIRDAGIKKWEKVSELGSSTDLTLTAGPSVLRRLIKLTTIIT